MAGSGSRYVHDPIDQTLQEIRLISVTPETDGPLRCSVKHVNLKSNPTPEYRALSYIWGPPSPTQKIQVNGNSFVVRQNLYDFLHAFRERLYKYRGGNGYEDEVQWLWIDQVCINQTLTGERNHQVQMMSDIYRRANYVYVWLGKSDDSTEAVMKTLKSGYRCYHDPNIMNKRARSLKILGGDRTTIRNEDVISVSEHPISRPALQDFFGNPYWLRLWIVQEIMLARYIRVVCGETILSWDELKRFCSSIQQGYISTTIHMVPRQVMWLANHALSAKQYSYADLLLTFSSSECENPQDRVYGLQGLIPDADRAEIDYAKPAREIFPHTARAFIRSANAMDQAPFKTSLRSLDYLNSNESTFENATTILMKEAEHELRLHVVEVLVTLGDHMDMHFSELYRAKRKDITLDKIRAVWLQVARLCERMSLEDFVFAGNKKSEPSPLPNPSRTELIEFLRLGHELQSLYDQLRLILDGLILEVLREGAAVSTVSQWRSNKLICTGLPIPVTLRYTVRRQTKMTHQKAGLTDSQTVITMAIL
jgi:hypothetical protein